MELVLAVFLLFVLSLCHASSVSSSNYSAHFCFGDSYSDTGNFNILAQGIVPFNNLAHFPYGITYFGRPTGRASDGRVPVDFIGYNNGATLKVCCGGVGPYNFNASAVCGQPGVIACKKPSGYINWDGIHLTEAAYNAFATGWLIGPFANPPILGPL